MEKTSKRKQQTTRARIVEAAITVFGKYGYSGARTADIANTAGCAEGTVFRYFPKKIDLLQHVAEQFIVRFTGQIVTDSLYSILESSEQMCSQELIEAIMHDRIKLIQRNYELLKIVIYEVNFHPEVKALFAEKFMDNVSEIGEVLTSKLRVKLNRPELEANTVVRTILGMIISIFIQGYLIESELDDDRLGKIISESTGIVINGLKGA